jgi:outer membrane protein
MSRKLLSVCLTLMAGQLSSLGAQADTLQQIYDLARANDPTYRAAQAALRSGELNRTIGRAALLPNLNVSVNGEYREDIGGNSGAGAGAGSSDDDITTSYSATLNQTLFDMSDWYSYRSGDIQATQAEYRWELAQQDLVTRTVTAYLNVLEAVDALETTVAEKAALESQLNQTQQRFEVGLVAVTDVLEAQASYDSVLATEFQSRGDLGIAFEQLTILTGQQHANIAPLMENYPIQQTNPATAAEWVTMALQNSQSLDVARLSLESAEVSAKSSWSSYLPTLNGRVTYGGDFDDDPMTPDDSGAVVVSLDVPVLVFTGGSTLARRKQAYAQLDQAEEEFLNTQRTLEQSIRTLHLTVSSNINLVRARLQAIRSAESALEATQAGYEVGTRSLVDVLVAQQNLYRARRNYLSSRYAYIRSVFSLKAAAGNLTPADVESLNRWLDASGQISRSQYQ